AQRGDGLFPIELARAPPEFGIVRAADDLPASIAICRRKHNVSTVPLHLSLTIADVRNSCFFVDMEEQLDFVLAGASKAIFDPDIPRRAIETDGTPVGNRIMQSQIAVVFRIDDYLFGALFESQQPCVCLRTPQKSARH